MKQLKQLSLMLVALLTATGAWAQTENEVTVTPVTGQTNQWTFTMPAGNVELTPIYAPEFTATFKASNANTIQSGKATVSVTEKDGTTAYTGATLDENGKLTPLYEGQTITMTAAPGYKFKSVEAKKEVAPAEALLNITSPEVGQVIGSDGKNYAYASLPTGVTPVAKICYVSGSNGLALALTDEGTMNWSTAIETCAAHTPAFTGGTWKLASQNEWDNMINAAGSDSALRDGFSSVDGTNMQSNAYWSSTGSGSYFAWYFFFNYSYWNDDDKDRSVCVRACLAF